MTYSVTYTAKNNFKTCYGFIVKKEQYIISNLNQSAILGEIRAKTWTFFSEGYDAFFLSRH